MLQKFTLFLPDVYFVPKIQRRFNSGNNSGRFEKDRHLHKCIIPSTWFDCYSLNVPPTNINEFVNKLRDEIKWFHHKRTLNSLDAMLFDFSMDSNVNKLKDIYNQFYIELGSEKLLQIAREHRYLSSGDSAIFRTSALGLRPNTHSQYRPTQEERASNIIITMLKMKFSIEDNVLLPTIHTDQFHPKHEKYYLYMIKYFTFPHMVRYIQFRQRFKLFFMTDRYLDMYSRSCVPLMNPSIASGIFNDISTKRNGSLNQNIQEYSEIKHYEDSCHVCVISKGIVYKFNVVAAEDNTNRSFSNTRKPQLKIFSFNKIVKTLHAIKIDSQKKHDKYMNHLGQLQNKSNNKFNYDAIGIGALTALPREEWGHLRCHLMNLSTINQRNFHDIESAICVICLDDTHKPKVRTLNIFDDTSDNTHNFKNYVCENVPNRWFDKSTQIVVNSQSNSAILNNIACCDVAPSSRLISEVSLIERYSPPIYESASPVECLEYETLDWVTDAFTCSKIKQTSTYIQLINNSILESDGNIKLPFRMNYNINYYIIGSFIAKIFAYCMRKFKRPIRLGFGINRFSKNSIYDIISILNEPIYNQLIKYDGNYDKESEMYGLMNLIGNRIYESFNEPYLTSIIDALIYIAKLNNIEIAHFNDPLFEDHIYNYEMYMGTTMNKFVDFALILPPSKNSVVFSFQPDNVTRYHIISYNLSAGKAKANHIDHYELINSIETSFK